MAIRRPIVVVVVTYDSSEHIERCLLSVAGELVAGDAIVVVDNASHDDTLARVRALVLEHPALRECTAAVSLQRNLGFGTACNVGASRHPGMDVLLLNPDTVTQPGAFGSMRSTLDMDRARGAVGPRIERFSGELEPGCRRSLPRPGVALGRLSRLDRLFPARFGAYNRLTEDPAVAGDIEAGSGCCVLLRREAWDEISGFDTRFFMYGEDLDLFKRLRSAGWSTRYDPAARILHRKGASAERAPLRMRYEFHRAMWRYYRKHHSAGVEVLLAPLVAGGLLVRFTALTAAGCVLRAHKRSARAHAL